MTTSIQNSLLTIGKQSLLGPPQLKKAASVAVFYEEDKKIHQVPI